MAEKELLEPEVLKSGYKSIKIHINESTTNNLNDNHQNFDTFSNKSSPEGHLADFRVKDHGYAWVLVCAMFVSNALTTGYMKSFGIIFNAITDIHPEISVTMAGFMMGLLSGCRCIFSPVGGALGNMIGIRVSMFIGTSLCCGALISAYFCSSAIGYAITLGAMNGIGQCIIESTHVLTVSQYFDKKLSVANGIRVAGNPFGGAMYPLMFAFLLRYYGVRLLFIILGAIMSHIYICTSLTMPIDQHLRICALNYIRRNFANTQGEEIALLQKAYHPSPPLPSAPPLKDNRGSKGTDDDDETKRRMYHQLMAYYPSISEKKKKPLEFSYLKNPVYLTFLVMAAGIPMALPLVSYYMSIYAKNVVGLSVYEISTLVSIQSIIDVFLRLFLGYLNSKRLYKLVHGYILCLLLSGCGSFLMPFTTGLYSIMAVNFICSLGANSYHTFLNVILCDQFGKGSIATTYGFVRMFQGVFSLVHPVLIGYIVDSTGGFMIPFFVMGSGLLFSGIVLMFEPVVIHWTNSDIVIN